MTVTVTQQFIIIELFNIIEIETDALFEGSSLTAFLKSSLDIRLKDFLHHNVLLSTYSFLPF